MKIEKDGILDAIHETRSSSLKRYQDFFVGEFSLGAIIKYEAITCACGPLPGAVGYMLRKWLYPRLLKKSGRGVVWGRNITLRHPGRVTVGDFTAIDDNCLIDAKGSGKEGIVIGDEVIVSRNCVLQGKSASLRIGAKCNVGCNCVITSSGGVDIGNSVLLASNCYIGGGRYNFDRKEVPISEQGVYSIGKIRIGDGAWLGAGAVVIDGVNIGRNTVVAAGAVVVSDLPDYSVARGIPAKIIRKKFALQ
jgi:acetyltransferase-like isoleucine patch superfamily enzyme